MRKPNLIQIKPSSTKASQGQPKAKPKQPVQTQNKPKAKLKETILATAIGIVILLVLLAVATELPESAANYFPIWVLALLVLHLGGNLLPALFVVRICASHRPGPSHACSNPWGGSGGVAGGSLGAGKRMIDGTCGASK